MSRWLQLAERGPENSESLTDTRQEPAKTSGKNSQEGFLPVSAACREEKTNQMPTAGEFPHGMSPGNRPLTWTGNVVSFEEWQRLSEWERHGPGQRRWNGETKRWEEEQA